jgi:WD40 repeat protein
MFCHDDRPRQRGVITTSVLIISMFLTSGVAPAQTTSSGREKSTVSRAYVEYLQAMGLANDGSKPEALSLLADSLRLQPEDNPASALIFELLTEQRANTPLKLHGHTGTITYAGYSSDGTKILTASEDHTARLWDARTGMQLTTPLQHDDAVISAAFSPDGKHVVTGSSESEVRIWDAVSGKPITDSLEVHGSVLCVSFSHDGKMIAAGTDDGKLRTWNALTGQPLSPVVLYHEEVYGISFNREDSQLLVATGDNKADFLDPRTGSHLLKPLRHKNIVLSARFSPDNKDIITASGDETGQIWDAKTGAPTGVILNHGFAVESAAFSPDGSRVVTASLDHTARVWDAKTGQPITPPLQHPAPVEKASFSPDGRLVATVAADGAIRVWDAGTGDILLLPIRGDGNEHFAVFSPDGLSLLAVDGSSLEILDMPPHGVPPSWVFDMADFAATQNNYNQSRLPDLAKIHALRSQLLSSTGSDPWTLFGKWYFADSGRRTLSPWSQISLESYVSLLIERGDRESLESARSLSHDHPSWIAKIAPLLAKLSSGSATSHEKN